MQLYKVVTQFDFDNKSRKLGDEIVCSAREGEELIKKKLVVPADKELDPKNPAHKPMLKEARDRKEAKHTALKEKEAAKAIAKQEREEKVDTELANKREEALSLAKEIGREDIGAIEAMGEAQLEKEVVAMKGSKTK